MREDFSIFPAKGLTLVLAPQANRERDTITRSATRTDGDAWTVTGLEFEHPGTWTVKLEIDAGTGKPIVIDAPIVIER